MEIENNAIMLQAIAAIFIGGFVFLFVYIVKVLNREEEVPNKNSDKEKSDNTTQLSEKRKDNAQVGKSRKKGGESGRWSGRSEKQAFSHPWLLTTLKGHTGQVLDMEFSSNGKYLASCAEEDPDPGGLELCGEASSEKENSTSSSADPSPRNTKGLSRRQRKNRRRDDASPSEAKKKLKPKKQEVSSKKSAPIVVLNNFTKLNMDEKQVPYMLQNYILTYDQMLAFGYPIESKVHPGKAMIFKSSRNKPFTPLPVVPDQPDTRFDVNAREFVPGAYENVEQASGSSSDSGENLEDSEEGSTAGSEQDYGEAYCVNPPPKRETPTQKSSAGIGVEKRCCRCDRGFFITSHGEYLSQEKCYYHWGKLIYSNDTKGCARTGITYSCCNAKDGSRGCATGRLHVWSGIENGFNGPFDSYVKTKPRRNRPSDGYYGVYALDCEMCFTVNGLELAKVTVVGVDGRLVYDSFVRPESEIVDYNTRFSGISAKDLSKKSQAKSLREVQNDLMGFISANTILVGHGLENDLRALRIIHYFCVDTAFTFPHYNGFPFRRSLKALTSNILKREIQTSSHGHNSYDDAIAAMELMLWKVRKDFKILLDSNFLYCL